MNLFTPRMNSKSAERAHMELDELDLAKIQRGRPWKADITDRLTGKKYRVRGAACGSPGCRCDAIIVTQL